MLNLLLGIDLINRKTNLMNKLGLYKIGINDMVLFYEFSKVSLGHVVLRWVELCFKYRIK